MSFFERNLANWHVQSWDFDEREKSGPNWHWPGRQSVELYRSIITCWIWRNFLGAWKSVHFLNLIWVDSHQYWTIWVSFLTVTVSCLFIFFQQCNGSKSRVLSIWHGHFCGIDSGRLIARKSALKWHNYQMFWSPIIVLSKQTIGDQNIR